MAAMAPVYIESQVTRRDLHARLLLAARLATLGHPVLVGRDHAILAAAAVNAPGIYISDWGFTGSAAERLSAMRAAGHLPYAQCEESTAYVAPDLYRMIRLVPAALAETTAVFCTNGQQQALVEAQRPTVPAERMPRLRNTGNCRFELLGERWRGVYQAEVAAIRRRYGDFILITTNGKLRNVRDVPQTIDHLHANLGLTRPDAERFGTLIEQRADAQRRFILDLLTLARQRPQQQFVLRAKYNEIRPIEELFGKQLPANVVLDNTGGIQPWVLAATAVIMNNCTTGMDAHVAGTPAIFYRPDNDRVESLAGPAALSTQIDGREALASALARGLPDNPPLGAAAIEWFMPSLIRSSHQLMAEAISASRPDADTAARFRVPLGQRLPLWRKAVVHRVSPSRSLGGRIERDAVLRFVSTLGDVDAALARVRVRQHDFELYQLTA